MKCLLIHETFSPISGLVLIGIEPVSSPNHLKRPKKSKSYKHNFSGIDPTLAGVERNKKVEKKFPDKANDLATLAVLVQSSFYTGFY